MPNTYKGMIRKWKKKNHRSFREYGFNPRSGFQVQLLGRRDHHCINETSPGTLQEYRHCKAISGKNFSFLKVRFPKVNFQSFGALDRWNVFQQCKYLVKRRTYILIMLCLKKNMTSDIKFGLYTSTPTCSLPLRFGL